MGCEDNRKEDLENGASQWQFSQHKHVAHRCYHLEQYHSQPRVNLPEFISRKISSHGFQL